jgi:TonB family protein
MKPVGLLVLLCGALGAQTSWEQLIAAGSQALEKGSYLQAERSFEMALPATENRSQEATTLVRLGLVQERQEQWAHAEGYYFRAVSVGDEATALEHLARVLRKAGRQAEADEKQARAFAIRAARIAAASPTAPAADAVPIREADAAPQLLHRTDPEYSEEARSVRHGGTVELSVDIAPDGRVYNVRLERSLGLGLDEKAVEAVEQWTFKPGTRGGQPVTVRAKVTVHFRLL